MIRIKQNTEYIASHTGRTCVVYFLYVIYYVTFISVCYNLSHGEVYPIQLYVIKCVSYLRQVGGFLPVLRFPLQIKLTDTK